MISCFNLGLRPRSWKLHSSLSVAESFGVWQSPSYFLTQHYSSLGDLHVALLIACFYGRMPVPWGFRRGHCWFVWQNLKENQQTVTVMAYSHLFLVCSLPWIWTGVATGMWTLWVEGPGGMGAETGPNGCVPEGWDEKPRLWNMEYLLS